MSDVLVHDWIEKNGGAEKVLDSLVEVFPRARVLSLWNDAPERYSPGRVIESPLARTALRSHKALSVPLQGLAWRAALIHRGEVDRIIVSSHAFAHHVGRITRGNSIPKYVYVHTPARYVWEPDLDERGNHPAARSLSALLRPLDRKKAKQATALAANSEFVRKRILRCWDTDATVIHPPVDTNRIRSVSDWRSKLSSSESDLFESLPKDFLLGASRFVPYKRLDLVIRAGELVGIPVVLAGAGPDRDRLEEIATHAKVPVCFVDSPSDALLYSLYQKTKAYIFPAIEDFGIMPVEAMSAGAPVLCNVDGGAGESVALANVGASADFCDDQDVKSKLENLLEGGKRVDPKLMDVFDPSRFQHHIRDWVDGKK